MVIKDYYSISEVSEILQKSTETLRRWDNLGKLIAIREPISNYRIYKKKQLELFPKFNKYIKGSNFTGNFEKPNKPFSVLELFA